MHKCKLKRLFKLLNRNLLMLIVYISWNYKKVINKKIARNLYIFISLNLLFRVDF